MVCSVIRAGRNLAPCYLTESLKSNRCLPHRGERKIRARRNVQAPRLSAGDTWTSTFTSAPAFTSIRFLLQLRTMRRKYAFPLRRLLAQLPSHCNERRKAIILVSILFL